ncbi:DUF1932 domain-containing protein [Pseudooceanicola sp. MF1-13]|uniref:DUF1932 domain-containing protein n=1 Tax=Pseudooceanicola sp. MF1-13 TaxID=3379095 RepID=UPI0038923AEE
MTKVIALPLAGAMGAGLGRVLVDSGLTVLTCLEGRSAATRERAKAAGMTDVTMADIAGADIILSVVPPHLAVQISEDIVAHLPEGHRPIYADLNAVNPERVKEVSAVASAAGLAFVDGGIIGGPPKPGAAGPAIYFSGDHAEDLMDLTGHGLDLKVIGGGVGAASAVKMCYGAMTKGTVALTAAMLGAVEREGLGSELHAEMMRSRPAALSQAERALPDMFPKAYRWIDEMRQIAGFLGDRPEARIWLAIADYYEVVAADFSGSQNEVRRLTEFLSRKSD